MAVEPHSLRILHTSDWHLGRTLHECSRDDEFDAFLEWMLQTIEDQKIDVLLIAGDIFDTSNVSHTAQQKYFEFCTKLSRTCCRHAVITSGNHDSTSFIDVPRELLACLNIHVVGQARFGVNKAGSPSDEIVVIKDDAGNDALIVAAVPFLQEGDVRFSEINESTADKEHKTIEGIARHYNCVADEAEKIRAGRDIPVIAMGHLYVQGGKFDNVNGSERQTYIGSLGGVKTDCFDEAFDYVALGHLHSPQMVGGCEHIRYSGAPIPMGFGEAGQQKGVYILEANGKNLKIIEHPVPSFHKMVRILGDRQSIASELQKLIDEDEEVYVSVTYTGSEYIDSVSGFVDEIIGNPSKILCLNTQNLSKSEEEVSGGVAISESVSLEELDEKTVFQRLLDSKKVSEEERQLLTKTFEELLISVKESE